MALSERLAILITANGAAATKEFRRVGAAADKSLATAETRTARLGATLTRVGAGMTVFGAVTLAGMYKAAQAYDIERTAHLQLENTIANIPELAGASTEAFYEQASALQQTTKYGDEATVSMQAMLGTFHLTQQQILDLAPLVQDYASRFGVDLVDAAKQVGKAVEGQRGALQRNGVILDENAYAADHFSAVMDALKDNAGGFAEQEGQTLTGQLERLKNNFGDVVEVVGGGAASAFGTMAAPVEKLSEGLKALNPEAQDLIGKVLTFGAMGLTAAGGLSVIAGGAVKLSGKLSTLADSLLITRARLALLSVGGAGFIGVAAAAIAGAAALASYTRAQEQAARVQNFADALKAEAEGMEDATNAALAHVLATDDQISKYRELGISAETIVAAIRGEAGAWDELEQARMNAEAVMADSDVSNQPLEQQAASVRRLVNEVGRQRDAYQTANGAQEDFEAAMAATGDTAQDVEQAISDLSQEIDDYLGGILDVPAAQRELSTAFTDLRDKITGGEASLFDIADAQDNVVRKTAELIDTMNQQGASQADLDAAISFSVLALANMRNSGEITQRKFAELSSEIRGVPHTASTSVSAPGADDAINKLRTVRTTVDGIPRDIQVRVSVPNLGAIAADVAGAAAQLRSLRGYAGGTESARSGLAVVGENGPELIQFRGGERVIPNSETERLLSGAKNGPERLLSSGGLTVNFNGPVFGIDDLEAKLAESSRRYNLARSGG